MSNYSIPHGIAVAEATEYTPSAATVAEYDGCSREYLLWCIEDLRETVEEHSATIAAQWAQLGRLRDTARAFIDGVERGDALVVLTQAELDARVAEPAPPKRRRARRAD